MASARDRAAARTIAAAWREAKAADSTLSQGEFAQRTFPSITAGNRQMPWAKPEAARELRRILAGKSSRAGDLLDEAQELAGANIEVRDARGRIVGYANVALPAGASSFDLFRLRRSPQGRRLARQVARAAFRNSPPRFLSKEDRGSPGGKPEISAIRQVRNQRAPFVGVFESRPETLTQRQSFVRARAEEVTRRGTEPEERMQSWIDRLIG